MNRFNNALVNFGKNLAGIENDALFGKNKFAFAEFERKMPSEVSLEELLEEEKEIFHKTKTKLKIKKDTQKLIFPQWACIIESIKFVGKEF